MHRKRNIFLKHGQTMIEYMLLFAIIILVAMAILRPGGWFSKSIEQTANMNIDAMLNMSNRIFGP